VQQPPDEYENPVEQEDSAGPFLCGYPRSRSLKTLNSENPHFSTLNDRRPYVSIFEVFVR
jgi:hypothetical protein